MRAAGVRQGLEPRGGGVKFSAVVGPTGGPRPHNLTGYMDWLNYPEGPPYEEE